MKSGHGKAIPYHAMFDSAFRKDPFPFYAYLRGTAPVIWDDVLQAWVVTRADDVQSILRDAKTCSSNRVSLGRARFSDPELESLFDTIERLMLQRDEPDHTRLRRLVTHAFQKAAIESYAPRVRDLARELIDPRLTTGQIEFVADYAVPLPILVISEILGIPPEDRARVKQWCDDFSIVALNFYAKITDDQLHAGREAVAAFSTYLADQIAARRGSRRDRPSLPLGRGRGGWGAPYLRRAPRQHRPVVERRKRNHLNSSCERPPHISHATGRDGRASRGANTDPSGG